VYGDSYGGLNAARANEDQAWYGRFAADRAAAADAEARAVADARARDQMAQQAQQFDLSRGDANTRFWAEQQNAAQERATRNAQWYAQKQAQDAAQEHAAAVAEAQRADAFALRSLDADRQARTDAENARRFTIDLGMRRSGDEESKRRFGIQTDLTERQLAANEAKPEAQLAFKRAELQFDKAMEAASQGAFGSIEDVDRRYPDFKPADKSLILETSLTARKPITETFANQSSVATALNDAAMFQKFKAALNSYSGWYKFRHPTVIADMAVKELEKTDPRFVSFFDKYRELVTGDADAIAKLESALVGRQALYSKAGANMVVPDELTGDFRAASQRPPWYAPPSINTPPAVGFGETAVRTPNGWTTLRSGGTVFPQSSGALQFRLDGGRYVPANL